MLEAYAADFPKRLTFERTRTRRERDQIADLAINWGDRLTGKAREAWHNKVSFKIPDAYKSLREPQQRRPMPQPSHRPPSRKQ